MSARQNRSKLLDPFGRVDFTHENIPERVRADRVREVKLTGKATVPAEVPKCLTALPVDRLDDVVMRVCDE